MSSEAQRRLILHMSVSLDGFSAVLDAGRVEEEIPRLKGEPGGDVVVFGGPRYTDGSTVQVLRPAGHDG